MCRRDLALTGGVPTVQTLDDVHALEHLQIGGDSGRRRRPGLVSQRGVLGDGLRGGGRGDVARERTHDAPRHIGRSALLGDADLKHGIEVLIDDLCGRLGIGPNEGWPATAAYGIGQRRQRRFACRRIERAFEQPGQRHRARGQAALPQRHGAHVHAGDAPGAAVGNGVLSRGGRSRENEQAALAAGRVDRAARGIPGGGGLLPLVDDVRACPLQRQRGVGLGQRLDVWVVKMHDTLAERQRRPELAAPLGTANLNCAEGGEQPLQAFVDEPRTIRLGLFGSICDHGLAPLFEVGILYFRGLSYSIFEDFHTSFSKE